jgi:DNA-binding transcriptional LysR family regulator
MPLRPRVSDLVSFDLLVSVAQLGSIGRAAVAHGMSQPAASARLRELERHVGAQLLKRTPRGAQLTTMGELVAGWAQPVLERAADLEAGIAALAADRDTHLTIAASLTIAEYLLPRWLIALRTTHPDSSTALVCGNSTEVTARIVSGHADVGFVEAPLVPSGVHARDIGGDELAVVVSPTHPWARRTGNVTIAEVATTAIVSREPGSGTRQAWERALRAHVATDPPTPILEMSSTTAIKAAVMGGVGPAVLSARVVCAEVAAGTLVRIAIPELDLHRRLHAIWAAGNRLHGPAADLLTIALRT